VKVRDETSDCTKCHHDLIHPLSKKKFRSLLHRTLEGSDHAAVFIQRVGVRPETLEVLHLPVPDLIYSLCI